MMQREEIQAGKVEHDAAGLLNELLEAPGASKSEFELLLEAPAILPDRVVETPLAEPTKYPAENSVFTSITEYAPEPEIKRMKKYPCPYCGRLDCPWAYVAAEED